MSTEMEKQLAPAPAVPEGWSIRPARTPGALLVNDGRREIRVYKESLTTAQGMLYELASAMLSAAPNPEAVAGKEGGA